MLVSKSLDNWRLLVLRFTATTSGLAGRRTWAKRWELVPTGKPDQVVR
jgi:hypothetical protein